MSGKAPRLAAKRPKSILTQQVSLDYKALGIAVAKGAAHAISGKFDDLAGDGAETLAALGLEGKTPEVLLFVLLQQSLKQAVIELLIDSKAHLPDSLETDNLAPIVEKALTDVQVDSTFFKQAARLPLVHNAANALREWLVLSGSAPATASTIARRLPGFFPYALHQEWKKNGKYYEQIREQIHTPFAAEADREEAWQSYGAQLQRRLNEGIFDEPFSLKQIYVPLSASYEDVSCCDTTGDMRQKRPIATDLTNELESWLASDKKEDAIRVISGGPGCGKSSFARVFAAKVASEDRQRVLFVPLHLIDPNRDFVDEIGRFVREEGILKNNPMDAESRGPRLLIILDGLDELSSQGKTAATTARNFVRSVHQTVDRRNINELQLQVLFCGREVVLQESESEFRRPKQILTVLPYKVVDTAKYHDVGNLLSRDLRQEWWTNYGELTGDKFGGVPKELNRADLVEITAQPLLNYLLALSFRRKKLNFSTGVNLNQIYRDLVGAVHERGYEQGRRHSSVRDISFDDFFLILEEIGLAAWHGDGRSTTVAEIEQHCDDGGLSSQMSAFQDGAKQGITQLLAAFFFRQHGERPKGDRTFVFTHKSFGEYLAARRLVHGMQDIVEEMQRRDAFGRGKGWSESEALERWVRWCGPTALSPSIHQFMKFEIALLALKDVELLQGYFVRLFNCILRSGMPMEKILLPTFQDAMFQSRNAEEALLVALNACAICTRKASQIEHPTPNAFGSWFKRIQGQRIGSAVPIAAKCLSWLNLTEISIDYADFFGAKLSYSDMSGINGRGTIFEMADLESAVLTGANMPLATFRNANLTSVDFTNSDLNSCNLNAANLLNASLRDTDLRGANLCGANFLGTDISGTDFRSVDLSNVDMTKAIKRESTITPLIEENLKRFKRHRTLNVLNFAMGIRGTRRIQDSKKAVLQEIE